MISCTSAHKRRPMLPAPRMTRRHAVWCAGPRRQRCTTSARWRSSGLSWPVRCSRGWRIGLIQMPTKRDLCRSRLSCCCLFVAGASQAWWMERNISCSTTGITKMFVLSVVHVIFIFSFQFFNDEKDVRFFIPVSFEGD